jgi:hypothetical protein
MAHCLNAIRTVLIVHFPLNVGKAAVLEKRCTAWGSEMESGIHDKFFEFSGSDLLNVYVYDKTIGTEIARYLGW